MGRTTQHTVGGLIVPTRFLLIAAVVACLLALVATLPLLLPLRGLLKLSLRSLTWAGYLVMLYLVIGIMEAWSNPAQRAAALLQTGLVVIFVGSVLVFSRRQV